MACQEAEVAGMTSEVIWRANNRIQTHILESMKPPWIPWCRWLMQSRTNVEVTIRMRNDALLIVCMLKQTT